VTSAPTSCSGLAPPRPSAPCSRRGEDWAAIARATSSPASRRIHHRSGWAAGGPPLDPGGERSMRHDGSDVVHMCHGKPVEPGRVSSSHARRRAQTT
jgi:hypothetical protein